MMARLDNKFSRFEPNFHSFGKKHFWTNSYLAKHFLDQFLGFNQIPAWYQILSLAKTCFGYIIL